MPRWKRNKQTGHRIAFSLALPGCVNHIWEPSGPGAPALAAAIADVVDRTIAIEDRAVIKKRMRRSTLSMVRSAK
jgi:hypothetical protein